MQFILDGVDGVKNAKGTETKDFFQADVLNSMRLFNSQELSQDPTQTSLDTTFPITSHLFLLRALQLQVTQLRSIVSTSIACAVDDQSLLVPAAQGEHRSEAIPGEFTPEAP